MSKMITLTKREDQVGVIVIDVPNASQNTLTSGFREAFEDAIKEARDLDVKALVIASKKPGSFIAGADIQIIRRIASKVEGEARATDLQNALNNIEKLPIPIVAAIHGACLGGGLELALACHARVASDDRQTKLGLPEVQLGLLPAAGGTQRLPRTIGVERALDLMLTGKQIDGRRAKKYGLVGDVVPEAILIDVAAKRALELVAARKDGGKRIADRVSELTDVKHLRELALAGNPAGRNLVFKQAEKAVRKRTGEHYPAPYRILEATRIGLEKGMAAGLAAEARLFGELIMTDVSRRLIEIFFATTEMRKSLGFEGGVGTHRPREPNSEAGAPGQVQEQPRAQAVDVRQVAVVGAGIMGHGIACVTALRAGIPVRIKDRDDEALAHGLRAAHSILAEKSDRASAGAKSGDSVPAAMRLISGTTDYTGFRPCQVIIEAVFEDLKLKHKIIKELEAVTQPDVIIASNTSSIPIARIAEASSRPERVVGMHYFSPVHKMPLLEVIRTKQTSDEVVATAVKLGRAQGKTVIVVNDGVGFYTSRILGPYLNEAAWMLSEGTPIETIDEAATRWGFPVGPIALLDEIGIDTAAKVAKIAHEAFGERMTPPDSLARLIEDGRTGRKGGRGFYLYEGSQKASTKAGDKKKRVDESVYATLGIKTLKKRRLDVDALGEQLGLQMVLEAVRCMEDGILQHPRDGDIGAIFGLGFPPFRGGPFRTIDSMGAADVLERVKKLEERFGKRFTPPELLIDRARTGEPFYKEEDA
ncbi:MAG: enoyl-CoA hydratase/isomerase family protein [Deltaproteobacteria bacterium]|nr:enoyl-CoA hydratase/isomerase family protein [Deltaproteobacteria bacterium]